MSNKKGWGGARPRPPVEWLDKAVLEYIKNNPGKDSVDICTHFKLRADITMAAIERVVKAGRVERVEWGIKAYYRVRD